MQLRNEYDVAIIGGGLAGLSAAICLRQKGHSVALLEKEHYPFHKVCGEYLSMESWNFLERLGLPLSRMQLPIINTLFLTAPNGNSFTAKLPLGGFGISRYLLDASLAEIARRAGVHLIEGARVDAASFDGSRFSTSWRGNTIASALCFAAFGKRSNLDIKWDREFLKHQDKKLDNHIGIKYHVRTEWPAHVIGLHNFEYGYAGISKIEDGRYCVCYMTRAESLKKQYADIGRLQETILSRNPHLKNIFSTATILKDFPVTIAQIGFHKKTQVEDHILMLGDAGGMITPLCGNGMSIALHTGKMAAELGSDFLQGLITREQMEASYKEQWRQNFHRRLQTGRTLQRFFGSSRLSNAFVSAFRTLPFLARPVVKMTHGRPF